jgi:hypothetical protein
VREHGRARRARIVALVVGRQAARQPLVLLELGVRLAIGGGGAEQPRVDREGLGGIDGRPRASMASGPAMTESASARSSALRASGPTTSMSTGAPCQGSAWPSRGTMPQVGLWPYTPQ